MLNDAYLCTIEYMVCSSKKFDSQKKITKIVNSKEHYKRTVYNLMAISKALTYMYQTNK